MKLPDWLHEQLPFDHAWHEVRGRRMHVMTTGEGPTVLLVHGNPTWGYLWRKVVARLEGFHCVMPDLVGLGLSEKPEDPAFHRLDTHVEHLADLVERLDLREVTLVVQDWGGPIGVGSFMRQPERLRALVVLNTVLGPPKPGFRATAFHRFSQTPGLSDLVFRGLGFPQVCLWTAQGDRRSIGRRETRAYTWPLRDNRVAPLALARMVPDSMEHPSVATLTRIHRFVESFDGPAAIVWGDRDPILGRLKKRIGRALPQATLTETQAGHFLQEEVPEEIAEAIRSVR